MWVLVASIILLIMAFAFRAYVISEEHYLDNLAFNPSSMSDCLKFSSDPHGKEASCIFRLAYIEKDETKPPRRFSPASIISELEKAGLGTKATRANILETL